MSRTVERAREALASGLPPVESDDQEAAGRVRGAHERCARRDDSGGRPRAR